MTQIARVYSVSPNKCKNIEQKINMTKGFQPVEGVSVVMSDSKGVQFEYPVVTKNAEVFAKKGNSYIRLRADGHTGNALRWLEFQVDETIVWNYELNSRGFVLAVQHRKKTSI